MCVFNMVTCIVVKYTFYFAGLMLCSTYNNTKLWANSCLVCQAISYALIYHVFLLKCQNMGNIYHNKVWGHS